MLDTLESYRGSDGKLELRQCWPDAGLQAQHWKQTSNPYKKRTQGVEGYEAIDCPHSTMAWGGIEAGHGSALLDGSANNGGWWYYAIGSYREWNGGIPGPSSPVKCVELHARKPGGGEWVVVARQTLGYSDSWWTPNLWNTDTGA